MNTRRARRPVYTRDIENAHDRAMEAKQRVFQAQDAMSLSWGITPSELTREERTLRSRVEKRLAKVRTELEALDNIMRAVRHEDEVGLRGRSSEEP